MAQLPDQKDLSDENAKSVISRLLCSKNEFISKAFHIKQFSGKQSKDISYWKPNVHFIGVIVNTPTQHAMIVTIKKRWKTSWAFKSIIPITLGLKIGVKSENPKYFDLSFVDTPSLFAYEAPSQEVRMDFVREVQMRLDYHASSTSDPWIDQYFQAHCRRTGTVGEVEISDLRTSTVSKPLSDLEEQSMINEEWISRQMKLREEEFTKITKLLMFLGTWNVNGRKPEERLDAWLNVDNSSPDIYALGFQEMDLSGANLILGTSPLEAQWESHVQKCLNKTMLKYTLLLSKRLVGVFLLIFVKTELYSQFRDVLADVAPVGIMGMMGNKAGVAIRFNFNDSSICVVNSHLNAHQENTIRRNQDFQDISRRISFLLPNQILSIYDHDFLFWLGDLNYRIDMSEEEVKKKVGKNEWRSLLEYDQLSAQIRKGLAFDEFLEGEIDFAPTYKFVPGSNDYEVEKNRIPAWCDRILWRATELTQVWYRSHPLLTSDHKPVSALCEISVKSVLNEARQVVYQDLVNQLDKMDNETRPQIAVDRDTVEFPNMSYLVPVTKSIVVENSGVAVARFRFRPKLDEINFCPDWLWVTPLSGILVPGEKKKIKITVHIDNNTAPEFNISKQKLEDILLLHFDGGTDVFISIRGSYLPSCFGNTLTHLVRIPGPVCKNQVLAVNSSGCLAIPKELWRMIDFLHRNGLEEDNLFLETGVQSEMEIVRKCLDNDRPLDGQGFNIHSVAETLIKWLESLATPVVPFELYEQFSSCTKPIHAKQLTASLNSVHFSVFYYIIAFLRELLQHSQKNLLTAQKLAVVFSAVMIRPKKFIAKQSSIVQDNIAPKTSFVEFFLFKDFKF